MLVFAGLALGLRPRDAAAAPGVEARSAAAGVGVEVAPGSGPAGIPVGLRSPEAASPCTLLISVGRSELTAPGLIDPLLEAAEARGLRVVVRLEDEGWIPAGATPEGEGFLVDVWTARVWAFASLAGDRVAAYQILDRPADHYAARFYAFLLKRAAITLRAARPGTPIVSGSIDAADGAWAARLFAGDTAPYVDVLAARGVSALRPVAAMRDRFDPSAALWVVDTGAGEIAGPGGTGGIGADSGAALQVASGAYFDSVAAGAALVLFSPDAAAAPGIGELLTRLRALFPPGMGPATTAALPFDLKGQGETLAFFRTAERDGLAVYHAGPVGAPSGAGAARFVLRAPLEYLDLFDPAFETERRLGARIPAGSVVEVPIRASDLALRFRVMAEAVPLQESLQVGGAVELTAEEIIAKEREVRAAQAVRLDHFEAQAAINIHYRLAALDTSIDVLTNNQVFVHDGKQDYRQTEMFVDGARWRGKNPPYLPFLQPEKIKEIPLDIVLDEGYRYALLGRERVDGRDCYVISIDPLATDRSLYRGRVDIDSALFTRVRMEAEQTGLKDPLRSNHVAYRFAPIDAPDGRFWLPVEVSGQMVFELLGQNLVVERKASYSGFAINREGFGGRITGAYASGDPIFRDTPEGYFRVGRSGGEETLRSVSTPRNTFLVAGANIGFNGSPGLPFAGVNFFDFNYHDTGTQVDIAWAGPFVDVAWTNPHLTRPEGGRRPLALSLNGIFNALPQRDKNARATGTDSAETIDVLGETVQADLALPMGPSAKWTLEGRHTFIDFQRRSETSPAFVLPVSTIEQVLQLRLEVNRAGITVAPWVEAGRRSSWAPWGLPGNPFSPDDRDFTRRGLTVQKSFYLGTLRKISLQVAGFDGKGLDRFSRFELGDFRTARVRGFNGSGIHFDRGLTASAGYAFTLREVVRVDAGVDLGWIQSLDDFGPGYERVIGAGLGLEFSGPWSTLVNVRAGRGVSSTIIDKGGGGDLRVVFFKTWDRWSRRP